MNLAAFGVRKPVVANLVMMAIIFVGLAFGIGLQREFFPEIRANMVMITAPYPGAAPDEVESSLAIKIEDRVAELDGVDEIQTVVTEGGASIMIKFIDGIGIDSAVADVQREIDALQDLPDQADRIIVDKLEPNMPVIVLSIAGDGDERAMKDAIRAVRDDLRTLPGMGQLQLSGVRVDEITVEVRQGASLEHGLSLTVIADQIRHAMVEFPGGSVKAATSTISIRTVGNDEQASAVREIVVKADSSGQVLRLGEIADVREGFADVDIRQRLNGVPAVSLTIYKVGDEDAVEIAELIKAYAAGVRDEDLVLKAGEKIKSVLRKPGTVGPVSVRVEAYELGQRRFGMGELPGELILTTDLARFIVGRLSLLTRNAAWGGLLVFLTLVILLNRRVSFWVALGLVVSILGTLGAMHFLGITLNMLTMFGLIVVIGLLVDDAIVVAENITARHERGEPAMQAAINGTKQVSWPVIATVLTTVCAFMPLALIEGQIGDMLGELPIVVAIALGVSLIETLFILPMHMAHSLSKMDKMHERGRIGWFERTEERFDAARDKVLQGMLIPGYVTVLRRCMKWRYLTLAATFAVLIVSFGMVKGGRLAFIFFEANDAETLNVELRMPVGTPLAKTDEYLERLEVAAQNQAEVSSIWSFVGGIASLEGAAANMEQTHLGQLIIELHPVEMEGRRNSNDVIESIRQEIGELSGMKGLSISGFSGGPEGPDLTLGVVGNRTDQIVRGLAAIREMLSEFEGIADINDDMDSGQPELQFSLRAGASELGFTTENIARQVRGAVYGIEAHTFAGNQEDVDVRVILPKAQRRSLAAIERMYVFTPSGVPVPLLEVVHVQEGHSYASIRRLDRQRVATLTAEVAKNPEELMKKLRPRLAKIEAAIPGIRILERGRQQDVADSFSTLPKGLLAACVLIYLVLAWLFSSYTQPLIVMAAIPFATIGMIWGHLLLGYTMTFLSLIGFIALAGVVVNDSLIFIEFFNLKREDGLDIEAAAIEAGRSRVRPILLTTLTTVFGLLPLMLERSFQAVFLIPMAVTISFGLLSATGIILLVLPCLLLIMRDIKQAARILWTGRVESPVSEEMAVAASD